MKITPVVIRNFKAWLMDLIEESGIDPAIIGLTSMSDENIKKFLEEYCKDLTYEECKDKILEIFPVLKTRVEIDKEAVSLAQQQLSEYYGTPYISEAFKEFLKKHNEKEIEEMIRNPRGTPLEIFLDYCKAKYGAEDIDIRQVYELKVYGIDAMKILHGTAEKFFQDVVKYMNYKPTTNILQLIGYGENIAVAHKNPRALVLIAIIDDEENVVLPVTQSDENEYMVVLNKANKRVALIY